MVEFLGRILAHENTKFRVSLGRKVTTSFFGVQWVDPQLLAEVGELFLGTFIMVDFFGLFFLQIFWSKLDEII